MVSIGDNAPKFNATALVDGEEKQISLDEFKGKKVALYFYPKDMTLGCTTQACNLRDNYSDLEKENIIVIGVSKDPIKSHINFVSKKELPFILISDEDLKVNESYGVWVEKNMYGRKYMGTKRNTFLIDEQGIVKDIIEKPKVSDHSKEILDRFQ